MNVGFWVFSNLWNVTYWYFYGREIWWISAQNVFGRKNVDRLKFLEIDKMYVILECFSKTVNCPDPSKKIPVVV